MKSNIAAKLSLRAKFKSFDTVEVCIIDSETGEIQLEIIPITIGRPIPSATSRQGKRENTQDSVKAEIAEGKEAQDDVGTDAITNVTEKEEAQDDTDSNEDE